LTIRILGSDDQKEVFFKEFDMVDQLSELYKFQGRFRELYILFVENGKLMSALDTAISCDLVDDIPTEELEIVLHYLHAETFFSRDGGADMEMPGFETLQSRLTLPPSLKTAASLWDAARHVYISFNQPEISTAHGNLKQGRVWDFLLLFVSFFYIFKIYILD
jgi:hypothetical protein